MSRTTKQQYKYLDDLEKKELEEVNVLIEQSRIEYKNKILSKLAKNQFNNANFLLDNEDYKPVATNLFRGIDELNIIMFKDISEYYYKQAIKDIEKVIDKEVKNKYDDSNLDKILAKFIIAEGINYSYNDEIKRRLDYFNSQMINASMAVINNKVQKLEQKYINENYQKVAKDSLDMFDPTVNETVRTQKKSIGNFIDNVAVFVAGESAIQAFKDNDIKKVVWIAEEDDRTCEICDERSGEVYNIDEVPTIPVHRSCRCHIEPYKES